MSSRTRSNSYVDSLRRSAVIVLALLILSNVQSAGADQQEDAQAIQKVILDHYIAPLYQQGDPELIRGGFHEGFNMYVLYEDNFTTRTREEWIALIVSNREKNAAPRDYGWDCNMIDVSGQTAVVKLTVLQDGRLKYIDYLTLYKFDEGWRVITKQFSMY